MTRFKKIWAWNMARGLFAEKISLEAEYKMLMEELDEFVCASLKVNNSHDLVDAMADVIVIATGTIYKLGYDADKVMDEVLKEINSRTGSFNEATGKWEKDKSPEAQARWYKADFSRCKLGG